MFRENVHHWRKEKAVGNSVGNPTAGEDGFKKLRPELKKLGFTDATIEEIDKLRVTELRSGDDWEKTYSVGEGETRYLLKISWSFDMYWQFWNYEVFECTYNVQYASLTHQMSSAIANWYVGLRTFALVGLLSVLLYIGIRIILSSTAPDKAKYKQMLGNWMAAICLVFILHYIMLFVITATEKINEIFVSTTISASGTDEIMSDVREYMIFLIEEGEYTRAVGGIIVYATLIIYTAVFTIQYFKRVVYMAFLTIIAPLITLTYPLDKIKDGKAQAFSMWLKEYMFNCLLQPIHMLLYAIIVGTAAEFVKTNPIYAVVAIGFLVPAEKFFRKMFGMETQTSVGTIGAAAGGAMVMSMLNKVKGRPPKEEAQAQPKVRTANQSGVNSTGGVPLGGGSSTGGASLGSGSSTGGAPLGGGSSTGGVPLGSGSSTGGASLGSGSSTGGSPTGGGAPLGGGTPTDGASLGSGSSTGGAPLGGGSSTGGSSRDSRFSTTRNITPVAGQSFRRGLSSLGSKYIYGKNARRNIRRTITGAAGGMVGLTIGAAAGVATGDLGNVVKYAGAGAIAGYAGASNLTENVLSGTKGIANTFKEGYLGTEAYNNKQFDKQFFASDEYKMLKEKFGNDPRYDIKDEAKAFLNQGFTDASQMGKLLEKGVTADKYGEYAAVNLKDADTIRKLQTAGLGNNPITAEDYKAFTDAGVRDVDKMSDLAKAGISAQTYSELAGAGITNIDTIKKYSKKYRAKTAAQLKDMKRIAKYSKKAIENMNKDDVDSATGVPMAFYNYASNFGADAETIKELWRNLEDFI